MKAQWKTFGFDLVSHGLEWAYVEDNGKTEPASHRWIWRAGVGSRDAEGTARTCSAAKQEALKALVAMRKSKR